MKEEDSAFYGGKELGFFYLNKCLQVLNAPQIVVKQNLCKSQKENILNNIVSVVRSKLFDLESTTDDGGDILNHLKDILKCSEGDKSKQIQILSILPPSWSIEKIETVFPVSNRLARTAKLLIQKKEYILPAQ